MYQICYRYPTVYRSSDLKGFNIKQKLRFLFEQLYTNGSDYDNASSDYDDNNSEEDYETSWTDYAGNSREQTVASPFTSSSTVPELHSSEKNSALKTTSSSAVTDRELVEMLAVLHKVETNRGEKFAKSIHETHKNIERPRTVEESEDLSHERGKKRRVDHEHEKTKGDHPKRRRAVTEETPIGYTVAGLPMFAVPRVRDDFNRTEQEILENSAGTDTSKIVTTYVDT